MMRYAIAAVLVAGLLLSDRVLHADSGPDGKQVELVNVIEELGSEDGPRRVAATKAIFQAGEAGQAALQKAGAKQVSPFGSIRARRLDVVYSLLAGLRENADGALAGYKRDSFGLHLEPGVTEQDVIKLGRQYGFTLSGTFNPDGRPQCYVKLTKGRKLETVLQAILSIEPTVVSVNLNYFES
ncbi:MAG: hypothetical protein RIC55_35650 [Pirellulaceae bacterium]